MGSLPVKNEVLILHKKLQGGRAYETVFVFGGVCGSFGSLGSTSSV
jgi:hypothetical protein